MKKCDSGWSKGQYACDTIINTSALQDDWNNLTVVLNQVETIVMHYSATPEWPGGVNT